MDVTCFDVPQNSDHQPGLTEKLVVLIQDIAQRLLGDPGVIERLEAIVLDRDTDKH